MRRAIKPLFGGAAVFAVACLPSVSHAANKTWTAAVSGNFGTAGNWTGGVPVAGDTATFNAAGTYTVTFTSSPINQDLFFQGGNVTFTSSGGPFTYTLNSTGGDDALLTGGSLTLGTGANPLHLVAGDDLSLQGGATLLAQSGSDITTADLLLGQAGGNGTLTVSGTGSSLGVTAAAQIATGGATGTLTVQSSATATLGQVDLAASSTAGTTGTISVASDADVTVGILNVATAGGTTTAGTVTLTGAGSTLVQSGASTLTVGHASEGTAAINIGTSASGGTLTTGTGLFTINPTGTVTVGNNPNTGTLNVTGDMFVNGGTLTRSFGSTFALGTGRFLTINNGGNVSITGSYNTAANATYEIIGAGSILETTSVGNTLAIQSGAQVNVSAQGTLSSGGSLNVGGGATPSTLVVDGAGSSADAGSASQWALGGSTANITFSNGATGSFPNGITIANSASANTVANVNVLTGADLITGGVSIATTAASSTSAALTVNGAGSTFVAPTLIVGHASLGSAVVNVQNGGTLSLTSGGATTLNTTATLNINGGTAALQTLNHNGGTINFTAGFLSYTGNLTVGTGGLLGTNLTLDANRSLTLTGATTVDATRTLTLDGGTLNTGSLVVNGSFVFNRGTLGITQPGTSVNIPIVTNTPSTTINVNANNVSLGSAGSFTGFHHQGTLNVNGLNAVTLNSAAYAQLGVLTTLGGGTINAPNGVSLDGGSSLIGFGTVNAKVAGELGSLIEAGGTMALGASASPAGFNFAGELRTNQHTVNLLSSAQASLGNLTTLGSGGSPGTLNAANGLVVDFGEAMTGFGTVGTPNDPAKPFIHNGTIIGNSGAQPITLSGYVKGVGSLNNANVTGTYAPGFSPATIYSGSVTYSGTLQMEIGGTSAGQFDAIHHSGTATLAGAIEAPLLNGFVPSPGQSFTIMTATGGVSGTFTTENFPAAGGGEFLDVVYGANTVTLLVAPAGWSRDNSGSAWSAASSWHGPIPSAPGAVANFGSIITAPRTVNVDAPKTVGTINFNNANAYTLSGSAVTIDTTSGAGAVNVAAGSHAIASNLVLSKPTTFTVTPAASTLTLASLTATGQDVTKAGGGTLAVNRVRASSLAVTGGTVRVAESAPGLSSGHPSGNDASHSRVNSLSIAAGGRLDLTNNDLIIDYTGASPLAAYEALVASGYNVTGDWQGDGINSSVAALDGNYVLAIADNAALAAPFGTAQGGPLFAGVDVDLDTILIKFTHRSDINLDGVITPDDSAIFGGNYDETITSGFTWAQGDMNYDGVCTPDDAAIFGGAYDESLTSLPEPAALVFLGVVGLLMPRRKKVSTR